VSSHQKDSHAEDNRGIPFERRENHADNAYPSHNSIRCRSVN
jgi:hypothetical protein